LNPVRKEFTYGDHKVVLETNRVAKQATGIEVEKEGVTGMSIFGAMVAGVSGLAAQSQALGMISDNIANMNTIGYKGVDADFSTLVTQAAGANTHTPGGVLSMSMQRIDQQGLLQSSASATDIALSGNGRGGRCLLLR